VKDTWTNKISNFVPEHKPTAPVSQSGCVNNSRHALSNSNIRIRQILQVSNIVIYFSKIKIRGCFEGRLRIFLFNLSVGHGNAAHAGKDLIAIDLIHILPRSRFVSCSSGVRREAFAVDPGLEGCGTRMDRSPNGRAEAVCAPSVPQ